MKEAAIEVHHTDTSDGTWDGPGTEAAIPADASAEDLASVFAWVDPDGDPETKAAYRFIHHEGVGGPANMKAAQTGIGVLNGGMGGTTIPKEDFQGVFDHLAAHLTDAELEVPPLKEAGPDHMAAMEMMSEAIDALVAAYQAMTQAMGGEPAPTEAFDPKSKPALESLAAAMMADPTWAMEVQKVAASLSPSEVDGDFVALTERAIMDDGTALLRVITPGWGSSGYYAPELLERDGPTVFTAGTKMFWNHQTDAEEAARPEGDLRDLAGELIEDASWNADGPEGPGLYAKAKVFSHFRDTVEELAPHIGVSIRAMGKASSGTVEGREGTVIDALTHGMSVDFVTEPGAGGKVLSLFEAAGRNPKEGELTMEEAKELKEAQDAALEARTELAKRDAADILRDAMSEAKLPEAATKKLTEALPAKITLGEDGKLDTEAFTVIVTEAIAAEVAYLTEVTGAGSIQNLGGTKEDDATKVEGDLVSAFEDIGLGESAAKIAAQGRN